MEHLADHHRSVLIEEPSIDPEIANARRYCPAIQMRPGLPGVRLLNCCRVPHPEARGIHTGRKATITTSLILGDGAIGLWGLAVSGG